MRRVPIMTLIVGGAVVLVLLAFAVMFQVRFSEVAVKVRLGKADESSVIENAGPYMRLPWPLERIVKFDRRIQVLDTPESEIKTLDGKNVIVGLYALWQIKDPLTYYIRSQEGTQTDSLLRARLNETRAAVIGKYDLSAFVSLDEQTVNANFDRIEKEMLGSAGPAIAKDYGIELIDIGIRRLSLPESVTRTVFDSMSQERSAEATRYREEGKAQAQAIIARAQSAADQIIAFAETKAKAIESAGIESTARILEQVKAEDRDFFIWLRWMDALKASMKEKSTIFFDSNSEIVKMFTQPSPAGAPMPGPKAEADQPEATNSGMPR